MEFISDEHARRYGDDYVKEIIKQLRSAGKNSSGKLINSLDYRLQDTAKKVEFVFIGEDYFEEVDKGRRPGSFPPIQAIAKWASAKGISKKAVFPIAKSIFRFGIKPTNVLKKANAAAMNGRLFNDLENYFQEGVEESVYNELIKQTKQ